MIRKEIAAFTIRPDIRCCASGCTVEDICVPAHDVILMIMELITSESAKQDGNEIEHPNDFVRNKQPFRGENKIEEDIFRKGNEWNYGL